jgi:hypothetical protein
MIKHIVLWTVKDKDEGIDKKEALVTMKTKLESLSGKIDGLVSLQVGLNENTSPEAYDICLITEHSSWKTLQFYQEHALHQEVAAYIGKVRKTRAVSDFEV